MFNIVQSHLQDILDENILGYPIAVTMLSKQIVVSKFHFPLKGTRAPESNG